LAKIAENCDHNIDPRLGEFSLIGRLFSLGIFLITEGAQNLGLPIFFQRKKDEYYFGKNGLGQHFG
jgi:hypothetical protein